MFKIINLFPFQLEMPLLEGRDIEALVIFLEFNFENLGRIIEWLGFDIIKRDDEAEIDDKYGITKQLIRHNQRKIL